jgi:hypothetical protein
LVTAFVSLNESVNALSNGRGAMPVGDFAASARRPKKVGS